MRTYISLLITWKLVSLVPYTQEIRQTDMVLLIL